MKEAHIENTCTKTVPCTSSKHIYRYTGVITPSTSTGLVIMQLDKENKKNKKKKKKNDSVQFGLKGSVIKPQCHKFYLVHLGGLQVGLHQPQSVVYPCTAGSVFW